MKYTSAQANKLLKKLNDEYSALLDKEQRSRDFRAAMGEDIESVRPAYDYAKTQARLEELEGAIRRLKHAINRFNTTQVVDGFGITIDEMLVYIPQLTKRKSKLLEMKAGCPKSALKSSTAGSRTLSTTPIRTTIWQLWRRTMKRPLMNCLVRNLRWIL